MIGGFSAGMLRLGLEINKSNLSGFWFDFADLNFLYFAIFSFLSCITIMIIVSMITPKPNQEQLNGLTYSTTTEGDKEITNNSWNTFDVVNSVIIIGILGLILIYFSPLGIGG